MVLAEKIVTTVQRATANTRWRDFADIWLLTRRHPVLGDELRAALATVAEHRGTRMRPAAQVLQNYALTAQNRWSGWRRKQNMTNLLPRGLADILDYLTRFADPIIDGSVTDEHRWDPHASTWTDTRHTPRPPIDG